MIIERESYKEIIKHIRNSPEATIITGMRRTGKTSLLKYAYDNIDSKSSKVFLDLENPINQKRFEEEDYDKIKIVFESMGLETKKKAYVFLDEIQFIKNLPSIVKYLHDHYKIKFIMTGSASFYLKNLFTESLSGRKRIFELYPLTFREFLKFKKSKLKLPELNNKIGEGTYGVFSVLYDEYLRFGGFPGAVLQESISDKKAALADIFSSYYQLEVMQLSDYRHTKIIRDLIILLAGRSGTRLDISKLARELGVSWVTISEYLYFLENTYFIKLIRPFSLSKDVEIRRSPKVYLCDSGLLNSLVKLEEGRIFENNVFQNLRLKGELNYYQRKDGSEIDFILNKEKAYEVKLFPDERDEKKLARLCSSLKIKEYKVISKNYSELKNIIYGFMIQ